MLKIMDFRTAQIVRMENLVNQILLRGYLRDIGYTCYGVDFLNQFISCAGIFLSNQVRKFDAIEERVKTDSAGFVIIWENQRRNFIPQIQNVRVCENRITLRRREPLHITKMLFHRKIIPIQFPDLDN